MKIEWNDIRAFLSVLNLGAVLHSVALIMSLAVFFS
jgi:hypothetical protein